MALWHITMAASKRHTLFPDEADLRAAVRTLVRIAGAHLLLFCIVDDHVHIVVAVDRVKAGRLTRSLSHALLDLRRRVPLGRPDIRPVEGRRHLEELVRYCLRQPEKHGVAHPARWSGSCLADLVGARVLPGFDRHAVWRYLPRRRLEKFFGAAKLPPEPLAPVDRQIVREAGAYVLSADALAAVGHASWSRRAPLVQSRLAAVHMGITAGLARTDLCAALEIAPRTLRELRLRSADTGVVLAVRLQAALRRAAA